MRFVVYGIVIVLMILHHDVWNWNRYEPLVFGVIPIGLAHHVGISLAAGVVWFLAVNFAWPSDVERIEREAAEAERAASRSHTASSGHAGGRHA